MLKKFFLLLTLVLSVSLAAVDFSLFRFYPQTMFYVHNGLSLLVGGGLAYFSYVLIMVHEEEHYSNILLFLTGLVMVVVHIVKLVIGTCV